MNQKTEEMIKLQTKILHKSMVEKNVEAFLISHTGDKDIRSKISPHTFNETCEALGWALEAALDVKKQA